MADTFKGIITADGKKRQLPYSAVWETPVSDETLSIQGAFADAKVVGDKFKKAKTETDSLKEDISNKITKFYASSQGEPHLADSDDGKIMDMMVYGKSEQKSTMGKNLLKLSEANAQGNANGLSATMNADGSISVTGASTSTWSNIIKINNECHTDNATYTFSVDKNSGIIIGLKLGRTKLDDANYQTHRIMQNQLSCTFETGASNEYCSLFLEGLTVGKSYNFTIYPMLELGTEATAYEPYTGGQPSPSPDYPQEIKSVVNPTVKVCGKNLFQPLMPTTTVDGVTVTNNGDGTYTLNGTAIADATFRLDQSGYGKADNLKKYKGTYTFSRSNTSYEARIMQHNTWKQVAHLGIGSQSITKKIDIDDCFVFINTSKSRTYNNVLVDLQIEFGSTATAFEPYHEQTVTLPYTLNAIPVESGGNVTIDGQQYIADYVDVERGKLVRLCKEIDLSTLNWVKDEQAGFYRANRIGDMMVSTSSIQRASMIAKEYTVFSWEAIQKTDVGIAVDSISGNMILSNQLREVPKGKMIYLLINQEEIDLTPEEITAFKALATYYPVTNISVNSEQLDGLTVFNYPISMANGWNYVKKQLNDNRDYIYDMDIQSAEAYVNSEYAVALTELEV